MNRLSPLVVRAPVRSGPARSWAIGTAQSVRPTGSDLRLFGTAFVGGLIVFGTFLA
jgi:hypothetical protein